MLYFVNLDVKTCQRAIQLFQRACELLEQNNMDGRNDDLIGFILAGHCGKAEEALPYLSDALARCTSTLLHICMGYANAFVRKRDYRQGMEILQWLLSVDAGLKIPGKTSYLDKTDVYKGAQWITYDDIGETALEGILNMIQDDDNAALLLPLWRQLERESEHQPTVEKKISQRALPKPMVACNLSMKLIS